MLRCKDVECWGGIEEIGNFSFEFLRIFWAVLGIERLARLTGLEVISSVVVIWSVLQVLVRRLVEQSGIEVAMPVLALGLQTFLFLSR